MNNLKRVLSLGLSGVMLAGLLSVGASAANFTDAEDIQHTDAVNTLVALKVIDGKPDGSFAPEETVTRSQMAKMIAVAMNGGNDTFTGTKTTPSFTDIKGHWAEAYIEYCADLDIISGRGDGTFDPDATVTGLEATKMVLTALGYNAEAYQLIGAKWASRTDQLAQAAKPSLYDELAGTAMNANATRDTAAQLIWNGLQNKTVKVSPGQVLGTGETTWNYNTTDTLTLIKERYNGEVKFGYLNGISYDKDKEEYTYSLTNAAAFGAEAITTDGVSGTFKTTEDVSNLFGQKVKVVYKDNASKQVYGIFASDSKVLTSAVVGKNLKLSDTTVTSVEIDDVTYSFGTKVSLGGSPVTYRTDDQAKDIPVYLYKKSTAEVNKLGAYGNVAANSGYAADLIDNDNDGKINCVVVTPIDVKKVTFVGKTSVNAGAVYKYEDCDIYEDVAKDDWAVITDKAYTAKGMTTLTKAEVVKGEVTATRDAGKAARVDGTWYTDVPSEKEGDAYVIGDEFELTVVNGYVFAAKAITKSTDVTNAVYVLSADNAVDTGTKAGTQSARLLFADGTKKIVTIDKINDAAPQNASTANEVAADEIYTYAIDKDGNYELTDIDDGDFDKKGAADGSYGIAIDGGKANIADASGTSFGTLRFADDAVVFVKASETGGDATEVKVLSGATVNKWKNITTTTAAAGNMLWADQNSNGFYNVVLGVLNVENDTGKVPGASGDKSYGWVTAKPEVVKDGDSWYVALKIWDGSSVVEVLAKESSTSIVPSTLTAPYTKGSAIVYDDLGNGKIENEAASFTAAAVTGYNGSKDIELDGTAMEIGNDTEILYVDTANNEGVEGGAIETAQETAIEGVYVKNVYYIDADGDKTLDCLIVDTANNLKENSDLKTLKIDTATLTTAGAVDDTLYLGSASVNANKVKVIAKDAPAGTGEVCFEGAMAVSVTQPNGDARTGNMVTGDIITVVAKDGSTTSYKVSTESKPA